MKYLLNALKEHWQVYVGLFLGLIIGLLIGVGFVDWNTLVKGAESKITDWIMALCTIGILLGTFIAATYAKKSASYSKLQLYLDKKTLNDIEANLILNLKVMFLFINTSPRLSIIIKEGNDKKIDNSLRMFEEHCRKHKVYERISAIQSTLNENSVLINRVLSSSTFELDITIANLYNCVNGIITHANEFFLNTDSESASRDSILEYISISYKNLLDCAPHIFNCTSSIESNLTI